MELKHSASVPIYWTGPSSLRLPPILDRKSEIDFWHTFEVARPRIFGAVLDILSAVLRKKDQVHIPALPRMADFATWGTAAEEALGSEPGAFMSAYEANRKENSLTALELSPAATAVASFVKDRNRAWEGTFKELLMQLSLAIPDSQLPKSPRALQAEIDRAEPNLLVAGVKFTRLQRQAGTGARMVRFEPIVIITVTTPHSSPRHDDVTNVTVPPYLMPGEQPTQPER